MVPFGSMATDRVNHSGRNGESERITASVVSRRQSAASCESEALVGHAQQSAAAARREGVALGGAAAEAAAAVREPVFRVGVTRASGRRAAHALVVRPGRWARGWELIEGARRVGGDASASTVAPRSPRFLVAFFPARLRGRVLAWTERTCALLALVHVLPRPEAEQHGAVWEAMETFLLYHVLQLRGRRHAVLRPVQVLR